MARAESTMLPLNTSLPEFTLPDGDGRLYDLAGVAGPKGLLVAFICNHCPYVKHINPALAPLGAELAEDGVGMVAISSNDIESHPEDAPSKMVEAAHELGYTFPYLYDETQAAAHAFGAACTPDFFLFNGDLELVYRGQFDETRPGSGQAANGATLKAAVAALVAGQPPVQQQLPSIGCNIKWKPGNAPDYFAS
ncbi:thioredoxin family protein [Silvimonas sp. JCM 19000]